MRSSGVSAATACAASRPRWRWAGWSRAGCCSGCCGRLGLPPARGLIFLWSPLLIFETAHAAHVDGLLLPLLIGAWWARARERDGLTGMLLGLATAMRLYPALLLRALAAATPAGPLADAAGVRA